MMTFDQLSNDAKVWVYVSKTKINADQKMLIKELSKPFLQNWISHGEQVNGLINVIEDCFLLISAEVTNESMCGRAVDANVRFVKDLENKTGLILLDRMTVAYRTKNEEVNVSSFTNVKSQIKEQNSLEFKSIFNPLVSTKREFINSFEEPYETSWIA
jgi:hypothetical protein